MGSLLQDLRYGARMLLRKPGFTVVAVLALALGIGANTAIFSVVNAVLLRPLPYSNPERLVVLWSKNEQKGISTNKVSLPDAQDWKNQSEVFDDVALLSAWNFNLTGTEETERIQGAMVTPNLFRVLGREPALGRAFSEGTQSTETSKTVIISHGLWQRRFGSDPRIIGQALVLNGESYTVLGVMPRDFEFVVEHTEIWSPLDESAETRNSRWLLAIGRLKQGITAQRAQGDLTEVARRLEQAYPVENKGWGINLVPLHKQMVGDISTALWVLMGAVGFVLLIACANVANLLLARSASRQKEMAIRTALGASRTRIVRQLLTESLLLSLLSGSLGVLLALWARDLLTALGPGDIPRLDEVGIDLNVLAFALGISLLTGILFSLAPALRSSKLNFYTTLRDGWAGSESNAKVRRFQRILIATELALSLILLIGAGLLLRSFQAIANADPGFTTENILTMQMVLAGQRYGSIDQQEAFLTQAFEKIEALPGVQSAGAITTLPVGGQSGAVHYPFAVEDQPASASQGAEAYYRGISPQYFQTMGVSLHKGRYFTAQDNANAPPVAIINQTLARRLVGQEADPTAKRIRWTNEKGEPRWLKVVGVVGDVRQYGVDAQEQAAVYIPYAQKYTWMRWVSLVVRTKADASALAGSVKQQLAAIDRNLPVHNVQTVEAMLSKSFAPRRFNAFLLGLFALIALLLAVIGIYGVVSYSVAGRTREIGIRMALGAQRRDVLRLIITQELRPIFLGTVLGLGGALIITRVMAGLLYGVSATDPVTFMSVSGLLIGVAILACLIPARRATRVDPMVALRDE
jgi:putative ABC transport system permease protein